MILRLKNIKYNCSYYLDNIFYKNKDIKGGLILLLVIT